MSDTITDLVKSVTYDAGKGILSGHIRNAMDEQQFIKIFVDAGKHVAGYERDKTEESEFRTLVFDEESMKTLAKTVFAEDEFSWMETLNQNLDSMLAGLDEGNRKSCKKHFVDIIKRSLRNQFPVAYDHSLQLSTNDMVLKLAGMPEQLQAFQDKWEKLQIENRQHVRQEQSENRGIYSQSSQGEKNDQYDIPEWNMAFSNVKWRPIADQEGRKTDIVTLSALWREERSTYPGWYIPSYSQCEKLNYRTKEYGLLQSYTFVDIDVMLAFCYEFVWRHEIGMNIYSGYEIKNIYAIWNAFGEKITDWKTDSMDEKQKEQGREWFEIGLALLRDYREDGMESSWDLCFGKMKAHAYMRKNGEKMLRVERLKQAYYHMDFAAMRRILGHCHLQTEDYELRLQVLGIRVELDEAEAVIEELKKLMKDIHKAEEGATDKNSSIYYASLLAGVLQLYSLCVQGVRDYAGEYEKHQEAINQIEETIEGYQVVFDWSEWRKCTTDALLHWHVKHYENENKDAFNLNREIHTIIGAGNGCESAYRFFRLLDRLSLPLQCGYVTLLGDWEMPWMEAVLQLNYSVGVFLLCRSVRSNTIETLIDRECLSLLSHVEIQEILHKLLDAFSLNMDEIEEQESTPGGLMRQLMSNVPELLIRFMSRSSEENQEMALYVLKDLMEKESLPVSFPMAKMCIEIMLQVSERVKARMLDTMLQTKIVEHKTLHGHGDGMDLFAYYFRKMEIGPLKELCSVAPQTIAELLEIPDECGYVWQTKVLRLECLDTLGLLSEDQRQEYAKLIWAFVSDNGLPKLSNMHLFAFEKMPCIDSNIPVRSVKSYFLSQSLEAQFEDGKGCRISMDNIPYLDELILVCDNMEPGYWSEAEADQLMEGIQNYWNTLREKLAAVSDDAFVWDEYCFRARRMVNAIAAIVRNVGILSDARIDALKELVAEMQVYAISTRELEIQFPNSEWVANQILAEMRSANKNLTVGAMTAAYHCILAHPDSAYAQKLLDEMLNILRYCKHPGVIAAAWNVHNLLYAKCEIMQEENLKQVDTCLVLLAEMLQTDSDCDMKFKSMLHVRKISVAIAFLMYQLDEAREYCGVLKWKAIAEDSNEINEVRNEWVWEEEWQRA